MNKLKSYIQEKIEHYEKELFGRCGEEYTIISVCIGELQAVLSKIEELNK